MEKKTPKEYMQLAIDAMRNSAQENRTDGKISPLVGAVVVFSDGTYETAYRGELRPGDHAEFTLLERKCYTKSFKDAVLYVTLESCRGRNAPKRGCAQHIINTDIRTVYVGIEDPDPTVAGDGLRYLLENGCNVLMFDKELQEIITFANKAFLSQAITRARSSMQAITPEISFKLKNSVNNSMYADFSQKALEKYYSTIDFSFDIDSLEFKEHLVNIGVLTKNAEKDFTPSGFGILLFHENPRSIFPQASIKAQIEYPDGKLDTYSFEQPLVLVPGHIEEWLEKVIRFTMDTSGFTRSSKADFPITILREAIVNALVHRDYGIEGTKIQINISDKAIEIYSPGKPLSYISLEQLNAFKAPSVSRNSIISYVFNKLKFMEEQGFGMRAFKDMPINFGFPSPYYHLEEPNLILSFPRSYSAVLLNSANPLLSKLTESELRGYEYLKSEGITTKKKYEQVFKLGPKTAERHLTRMVELGLVTRLGKARATFYSFRG